MNDIELARTIARRIAENFEQAQTLVDAPFQTIEPDGDANARDLAAIETLRAMGDSLGRELLMHETIGQGGMGIVRLATQATLGRHVAVKTLKSGLSDASDAVRMLREAWVTGTLEHPSIVPIYDVGVDGDGLPVIMMKRIEGCPWSELMADPSALQSRFDVRDPTEWNLRILATVCNAVHFAHSRGILHRDLKPDNVMVGSFGEVYVLDWGIAVSLLDDPSGRLPLARDAGELAGTPGYFAPEMLLGDPNELSARTDVYLLGAIFYQIFAGTPPHTGRDIHAIVASALLSNVHFPPHFPAEAQRICRTALSRSPKDRYATAEELRVAIEAYLQHRGSRKLAHDAKRSLTRLLETLAEEPKSEDRSLAIFNLLGECRFGYRSALSAWPDNESARLGLDQALLAVINHELEEGNAHAAEILLSEVSEAPPEVVARIERASRDLANHEARVRKLELDLDPNVGSRTRTLIGGVFGVTWTLIPLVAWLYVARGGHESHPLTILWSFIFLGIGCLVFAWARQTLTSTLLNRRIVRTLGLHLSLQILLGCVAWIAGLTPQQGQLLLMFSWCLTQTMLAIWVEPWFGLSAGVCAVAFVVAGVFQDSRHLLMSLANLTFTTILVRVWIPRQILSSISERRAKVRAKARQWLLVPEARREEEAVRIDK